MKFHILGAGPAGLATGFYLTKLGARVCIYEKEEIPGGMARSWKWNNFMVDTGPHILHTPLEEIWDDWKHILGDNLHSQQYYSANYKEKESHCFLFDYPINTSQLLESDYWHEDQKSILKAETSCFPDHDICGSATNFFDYVVGLVGPLMASEFFKVYPEKVWGIPAQELLPDWAPKRIRRTDRQEPFFGDQFCGVSKKGTGYLFESIVKYIERAGGCVSFGCNVINLEQSENRIEAICLENSSASVGDDDFVISTLPISVLSRLLGIPFDLEFRGIASVYLGFDSINQIIPDPYQWLYFSDPEICFNRITEPTKLCKELNLSPNSNRTYLIAETTYSSSDVCAKSGSFLSDQFIDKTLVDMKKVALFSGLPEAVLTSSNLEDFVYPIQSHRNRILLKQANKALSCFYNLEMLGTGANYAYNDIQVIFKQAKELANDILKSDSGTNPLSRSYFHKQMNTSRVSEISSTRTTYDKKLPTRTLIIAEVGINHNGSSSLLNQLVDKACNFADIIKLQFYRPTSRVGDSVREINHVEKAQDQEEDLLQLLDRCSLTREELVSAIRLIKLRGKTAMCTAFDLESLEFLLKNGITHIKVASMDLNNIHIHDRLLRCKHELRLFISTGMSSFEEVSKVAQLYHESQHKITLLLCNSSYPTPLDSVNIAGLEVLHGLGFDVGYSDHTIGITAPLVAGARGASCVEVHFTLNKDMPGPDQMISKTSEDLEILREEFIRFHKCIGDESFGLIPEEYEVWKSQKKSLYAAKSIKAGSRLEISDTTCLSPPIGIDPLLLLGDPLYAKVDMQKGEPITLDKLSISSYD